MIIAIKSANVNGFMSDYNATEKDVPSKVKELSSRVIKAIAPIVGGGGGGRKDMAQAGGKDPSQLAKALEAGIAKLKESIK